MDAGVKNSIDEVVAICSYIGIQTISGKLISCQVNKRISAHLPVVSDMGQYPFVSVPYRIGV